MNDTKVDGRVVITGGTGFLGLNLARALTAQGAKVILISRTPPTEDVGCTHAPWDDQTSNDNDLTPL